MGAELAKLFVNPEEIPHNFGGFVQLLGLAGWYGYIICKASAWIGDGCELLLLIPSVAGIVGSVVLPILGAVPDGAMVLFSGLGDNAQEELNVGIGALVGSTIVLLTVPWSMCIYSGRVNMDSDGTARYKDNPKLSPPGKFFGSGVTFDTRMIFRCSKWMLATSVTFLVIQIPAFGLHCGSTSEVEEQKCDKNAERICASLGLVTAVVGFGAYIYDCVSRSHKNRATAELIDQVRKKALVDHQITLQALFDVRDQAVSAADAEFRSVVHTFFKKYDTNGDEAMDVAELGQIMRDLGTPMSLEDLKRLQRAMDTDHNGTVDFEEFLNAMVDIVNHGSVEGYERDVERSQLAAPLIEQMEVDNTAAGEENNKKKKNSSEPIPIPPEGTTESSQSEHQKKEGEDDDDESIDSEESEGIPEEFSHLSAVEQRKQILRSSLTWLLGGVFVVLFFSDPMVDVLGEIGKRINVNPFYIAFVACPMASNASEMIATFFMAQKKTPKTMSVAFSALLGAATMNNTFCLSILLMLIVAKNLMWQYSAETIVCLVIEVIMFWIASKKHYEAYWAVIISSLMPLALLMVALLTMAGLN